MASAGDNGPETAEGEQQCACFNCFLLDEENPDDTTVGETTWSELRAAYPGLLRATIFFPDEGHEELVTEVASGRCLRYQEIHPKAFLQEEAPYVILFISHRWETPEHPDPTGRQFRAVASLLQIVNLLLIDYAKLGVYRVLDRPKHTLTEGVAQAHQIFNQYLCALYDQEGGDDAVELNDFHPDVVFERIGVFYDFMSLPQKPRTAEEEDLFRTGLKHFSFLARASTVIPLRFTGDFYSQRAWCALEFEAGNNNSSRDFKRGRQNTRFSVSFWPEQMHTPLVELELLKSLGTDDSTRLVDEMEHANFLWMTADNADDSMKAIAAMGRNYHSVVLAIDKSQATGRLMTIPQSNSRTLEYVLACTTMRILDIWVSLKVDTIVGLTSIVESIMNVAEITATNGADLMFVTLHCLAHYRFGLLKEFALLCLANLDQYDDLSDFSVLLRPVEVDPSPEETQWWGETEDGESKFMTNFMEKVVLVRDPEYLSEGQRSFITKIKLALYFGVPLSEQSRDIAPIGPSA